MRHRTGGLLRYLRHYTDGPAVAPGRIGPTSLSSHLADVSDARGFGRPPLKMPAVAATITAPELQTPTLRILDAGCGAGFNLGYYISMEALDWVREDFRQSLRLR